MSKLFLSLLLTVPAWAGEYAVLANGFRIHAERHETAGASVRLYTKDGVTGSARRFGSVVRSRRIHRAAGHAA